MRYCFGDAILDRRAGSLERNGRPVTLEPRTFQVLCVLVERAGELVEHETLTHLVWNGVFVTPHSLTEAISQLRRALGDDFRRPRIIETAHRRGYRFVAAVETVADTAGQRWRIPARLVDLFGRERDVLDVAARLNEARLVSLVGPGGVGKTQLALEAARRVAPTCGDGGVLIDLAPAVSQADVERLVADVVGVGRKGGSLGASIGSLLRDTDALIVLDNCERVHDAAGRLAQSILGAAAGVRVLATSQQALNAAGEVLVRVAPLACASVPDGAAAPAIELFCDRAAAVQPEFAKHDFDLSIVARICQRLDGLPLAIELAAARVSVLSPAEILERLDSRFDLLRQHGPASAHRHRTLTAVIEWSTGLLEPAEYELLQAVSVFAGAWDLEAGVAVAGRPADSATVLTHLSALVDKSLVFADTARESARYRLLDTVRLFARDRLASSSRSALVRNRMLAHYVRLGERADREWYSGAGHMWMERLQDERANFRAAFDWALDKPERAASGLELAGNLRWFWRASGTFTEARALLERALASAQTEPAPVRTRADLTLGQIAHHMLDFDGARDALDRGIRHLDSTAHTERAWALALKAMNAALSMRLDESEEAGREALSLATELHVDWLTVHARLAFGLMHAMRGEHERAVTEMSAAYESAVTAGDPFLESYAATNLGLQRLLVGDRAGARRLLISALQVSVCLRNPRAAAGCFEGYAYVAAGDGAPALAARLMGAAARIREITGAPLLPQWLNAHDTRWSQVQSDLGAELASHEWQRGEATPVDELTALLVG